MLRDRKAPLGRGFTADPTVGTSQGADVQAQLDQVVDLKCRSGDRDEGANGDHS